MGGSLTASATLINLFIKYLNVWFGRAFTSSGERMMK